MMTNKSTSKTNDDIYQAILILSASAVLSGVIFLFGNHTLTTILGVTKIAIGGSIFLYTRKHGVGKRHLVIKDHNSQS